MIPAFVQKFTCDTATARQLEGAVTDLFDLPRGRAPSPSALGDVSVIVDGLVGRCWALPNGGRQITAILLPGDLFRQPDPSRDSGAAFIEALCDSRIARIPRRAFEAVADGGTAFAFALRNSALVEEATLIERLVSFGRRAPRTRLAHLLCELLARHGASGRASGDGYDLSIDRSDLADALGVTVLNLNYLLQRLQADSLIRWDGRRMEILDVGRLEADAGFDPAYLRLGQAEPARLFA